MAKNVPATDVRYKNPPHSNIKLVWFGLPAPKVVQCFFDAVRFCLIYFAVVGDVSRQLY